MGLVLLPAPAAARPVFLKDLKESVGGLLPARLGSCDTCHYREGDPGPRLNPDLPRPHNAFGARLKALGDTLRGAGKRAAILDRLALVAAEDADGDGVPNEQELLLATHPGRAADRPTEAVRRQWPSLARRLAALRREHAWRPFDRVERPPVPAVKEAVWGRNPIDAFLTVERERRKLTARPPAPREVLLRRVTMDLIGLPPTPAEQETFLTDPAPNAYEKVVDRLLADPRYGERWARHWMDVWRYSDWDGYGAEVRNSQQHIWRWRDWIVTSLNADKGYDRMVREMLAGDELAPEDPNVLAATGFLARNWYRFSRHESLNRMIEGTGKAFLGLTLNCARCHDHKYDPITMDEFYGVRAVFEPYEVRIDRVPGEPDVNKAGVARVFDGHPDDPTYFFQRGDDRNPDKSRKLAPAALSLLGSARLAVTPVSLPFGATVPDRRPFVLTETRQAADSAVEQARRTLMHAVGPEAATVARLGLEAAEAARTTLLAVLRAEELEDSGGKDTPPWQEAARAALSAQRAEARFSAKHRIASVGLRISELEKSARDGKATQVARELEAERKKLTAAQQELAAAEKAMAEPVTTAYKSRAVVRHPATSTGRRTALANWIANRDNPLCARVAVNHIWLRHFGTALVPSVFDFGKNGAPPTHPALLDWLAAELMENGWSQKRIHRLIVTSRTYRLDSTPDALGRSVDPENRWLWRMNTRRAEAEAVRDSVLAVSGRLDPALGGPDLDPATALASNRRSIYYRHSVEKRVEFLTIFDQASVNDCYERIHTIMPQQALALANSPLSLTASRAVAADLSRDTADLPEAGRAREFIRRAFRLVLARTVRPDEEAACLEFLTAQERLLSRPEALSAFAAGDAAAVQASKDPGQRARESLVHSLFNHHEFVTIP